MTAVVLAVASAASFGAMTVAMGGVVTLTEACVREPLRALLSSRRAASGTGFAPIKAIAETIFHLRLNHDDPATGRRARTVVLYWGARARGDLYMNELPMQWAAQQPNFRYVPVLSDALPQDEWSGRTGFVHRAVMQDLPDLSQYEVYACGAPVMVEAARRDFVQLCGLPPDQFLADAFTSKADIVKD